MGRSANDRPLTSESGIAQSKNAIATWRNIRERLRHEYGPTIYAGEIARLHLVEDEVRRVSILCPNANSLAWVKDNLRSRIEAL